MYSDKLEELISAALQDGNLTEQKRIIIMRRAEKEGEDVEEVMLVVESRLQQAANAPIKAAKAGKAVVSKSTNEDVSGNSFVETVNGVSFKMIKVEGGTFTMFNDRERIELNKNATIISEKPQKVTLDDYYICETVVTQKLWKAVMGQTSNSFHFVGDRLPVNNITVNEFRKFIETLNMITNKKYHLPSEAQWEYAALGGKRSLGFKFAGSDDVNKVAWHPHNSMTYTEQDVINIYNSHHFFKKVKDTFEPGVWECFFNHYKKDLYEIKDVALLRPNELGLYDMNGNVYEVCEDDFDQEPMLQGIDNPIHRVTNSQLKTCRGGSVELCYSIWQRGCIHCNSREKYFGFRLAQ